MIDKNNEIVLIEDIEDLIYGLKVKMKNIKELL